MLGNIYELLGVLGEVHPSEMVNNSDKLYKAYLGELKVQVKKLKALNYLEHVKTLGVYRWLRFPLLVVHLFQMTSVTKEPKLPVVAGCLRGITALMVNFTKSVEEGVCLCF